MSDTVSPQSKAAKPFLKWVGGKTQLLPQITALMPASYNRYFEPFLGGGALFFALKPQSAVINDINKTLIHTYRTIKHDVEQLITDLQALETTYHALNHDARKAYFYERRDEFNSIDHPDHRKAVLMIFLNKTCFNGMYRENSKGKFNVPFGDYKQPKICDPDNLRAANRLLQGVEPLNTSYRQAVAEAQAGDFVYLDPPYHPLNATSSFTSYSIDNFSAQDQTDLRDLFKELDQRGCKVMLSNSSAEFIKESYKDFRQESVLAARAINSKGSGRGKINELIVLNYK